jgi:hypothetical protein
LPQVRQCPGAVGAGADHLGQQRVVVRRDGRARLDPRVDAGVSGQRDPGDETRARPVPGARVFGVHPRFDGVAAGDRDRAEHRAIALGQAQHPGDQVDAVDGLGDRVLHLQPGVDLEERRFAALGVVDVFDRARRAVPHRRAQRDGRVDQLPPDVPGQLRRRALLDDLLVAPLQRAVARAQGQYFAEAVAEHLDLDVPRAAHEPFEEDAGAGEALGRDAAHGVPGGAQLVR